MQTDVKTNIKPPKLIPVLVTGFNAIASNPELILFPIALDVVLLFGPLVRIKNLMIPIFNQVIKNATSLYSSETMEMVKNSSQLWNEFLEQFNLLFSLRTFPVGIPSLMVTRGTLVNPIGELPIFEINSFQYIFSSGFLLMLSGIVVGSIYFRNIARVCIADSQQANLKGVINQIKQSFLMSVLLILLFLFIALPSACFISSISVFLPALGTIPLLVFGLILIQLLTPLVFAPHGIFVSHQSMFSSIATSARLVRSYLPGTGLFMLVAILISFGLDILWSTPSTESWLTLVGIIGHAFISTSVIAASFFYYQKGLEWMEFVIQQRKQEKNRVEPQQ
ncbi:MAG TPA: hypothetical protein G4N92_03925 [Anaerolineae bacterium]|nr:hypothetical protein [Anaerolineae bacterium]